MSHLPSSNPFCWWRKKWIVKPANHFSSRSLVFIYRAGRSISSREKKVALVMASTSEDNNSLPDILVYQILAYHTSHRTPYWPCLLSLMLRFFLLPCKACDDPSICPYLWVSRAHGESLHGHRPLPGPIPLSSYKFVGELEVMRAALLSAALHIRALRIAAEECTALYSTSVQRTLYGIEDIRPKGYLIPFTLDRNFPLIAGPASQSISSLISIITLVLPTIGVTVYFVPHTLMSHWPIFKPSLRTNCTFLYKLLLFFKLLLFSVRHHGPAPSLSDASELIETTCYSKQCNSIKLWWGCAAYRLVRYLPLVFLTTWSALHYARRKKGYMIGKRRFFYIWFFRL